MTQKTDENKMINRYLLGELSEDELSQVEERYFADEDFFGHIVEAENSLIDSYARGSLSTKERDRFERQFLTTPKRRQKVKFAQSLQKAVAASQLDNQIESTSVTKSLAAERQKESWWQSLVSVFNIQRPALALGMGAVLLMFLGVWLFSDLQRSNYSPDIAKKESPIQEQISSESNQQSNIVESVPTINNQANTFSSPQNSVRGRTEQEQIQQKQRNEKQVRDTTVRSEKTNPPPSQITIATFVLMPGLVRGNGERIQITIPPQASQVQLQLNLEQDEYLSYDANLQNPDGETLWSRRKLRTKKTKGGKAITLFLPAKLLTKGDYNLVLKGKTNEGETENVNEYPFSIVKK